MLERLTGIVLAAALAGGLPAPAAAVAPFAFDSTPGRLPKTVVPMDYTIALVPDAAAKTLRGTETVTLDVRRSTAQITFNTHDVTVRSARLDGKPVAGIRTVNGEQLTTLVLARPAAPGRHTLALAFAGTIGDSPQGLFAQEYRRPDGTLGRMLSTQFESTDARRMFPSWDEPAFRATFALTVTIPAGWTAVSNTPATSRRVEGPRQTVTFARTPRMPSYLVELSAGDLASIDGVGSDGVKQSVWAVRGDEKNGRYALASALQILPFYDAYFGEKFPLAKLDHIAVPGGFGGAMENWGAITYNEDIIIQRGAPTLEQQQTAYSVVAHEMAHQWNGDLVTMGWWDDIWLNESFASWMAAKATGQFNPQWQWWQRESDSKELAMDADARAGVHPIQQHVTSELEADASFDPAITYDKGQAFLRMLEAYLGEDTFRTGIRSYVQAHKYSNATTADLWNALAASSKQDVGALARAWTEQPGYPLVSVSATCDAAGNRAVALAQRRFFIDGTADAAATVWNIPVGLSSANAAPHYVLLTRAREAGIPAGRCGEPLRVNAGGIGYYRVAYDAATEQANLSAFGGLPADDKLEMLLDRWALVRAGAATLPSYLALGAAMGSDRNAAAWAQIAGALEALERASRGTPEHDAVVTSATARLRPIAESLGWDPRPGESVEDGRLRRTLIGALGSWGDRSTIVQAQARFERSLTDASAVSADMLPVVVGIVAANADAATFDRIHALAGAAKDPVVAGRYRAALMRVRDLNLAERALAIAVSGEVPPQQRSAATRYVATVADLHPKLAWAFFTAHAAELGGRLSAFEKILSYTRTVPATFAQAATPDELGAWLTANLPAQAAPFIARGVARARVDAAIRERLRADAQASMGAAAAIR